MRALYLFIIFSLPLFAFICGEENQNTVVGSNSDVAIDGLTFTIDKSYVSGVTMYANGTVRNNSSGRVTSPWYVEGQFYTDSTYTLKLGGTNTQIYVPLDQGQATVWSLTFTPSQNAQYYPKFKVGDLRGVYKK